MNLGICNPADSASPFNGKQLLKELMRNGWISNDVGAIELIIQVGEYPTLSSRPFPSDANDQPAWTTKVIPADRDQIRAIVDQLSNAGIIPSQGVTRIRIFAACHEVALIETKRHLPSSFLSLDLSMLPTPVSNR